MTGGKQKILIFVPARGGSKGIPHKNLIRINGKPLINYTLETVSRLLAEKKYEWEWFISSDDEDIINYCREMGFPTSYQRPVDLAGDSSDIVDAIMDGLSWLNKNNGYSPDAILLLQPTCPIRNTKEILEAIKMSKGSCYSFVSVMKMREHPNECIELNNGKWNFLKRSSEPNTGRQNFEQNYYFIDGNFYFASLNFLEKYMSFIAEERTSFYITDKYWPVDIDEIEDLPVVSALLKEKQSKGVH